MKPKHHGVGFLRIRPGYFFELLKGIIKRDEGNWFPGSCDNLSTLLLPDCDVLVGESLAPSHVKGLIQPLGYFLVPIFFVVTGMEVRIETLFNVRILILALAISVAAFGGKIISGLVAGRVRKSIVGWGMVPRCEVGLIFAAMGKALGVFPDDIFSMMVIVIMFTTIVPPPILNALLKRQETA